MNARRQRRDERGISHEPHSRRGKRAKEEEEVFDGRKDDEVPYQRRRRFGEAEVPYRGRDGVANALEVGTDGVAG